MNNENRKKEDNLKYDIKTRVTPFHFERLQRQLASSHYRTMSELLRAIICEGRITVITKDVSLDQTMELLSGLRKELNAIGVNLNQVVKYLHSQKKGTRELGKVDLIVLVKEVHGKMAPILEQITQLGRKWLQE